MGLGSFGLIFLYMALPRFYRSYSIYPTGNAIPDTNVLATVAQWQFTEILIEIVQEHSLWLSSFCRQGYAKA